MVAAGRDLIARHPGVDTVVLECTNLPPYKKALKAALGLPVFDVLDLLSAFYAGLWQQAAIERLQQASA